MKKNISPLFNIKIKEYIEEYIIDQDNPKYLRDIVENLNILPLFLNMGICFGINKNGEIISFHFDEEFEPYIEKEINNINLALYKLSKLYPELKEFL